MNIENLKEYQKNTRYTEVNNLLASLKGIMEATVENYVEKRIPLKFTIGDKGSYTNMKEIVVDISENECYHMTDEEIARVVRFKVGHECQHVMSTTSEYFKSIENVIQRWKDTAASQSITLNTAKLNYCARIINAIEDGRIENIMCDNFPGLIKHRNWYRLKEWETITIPEGTPDVVVIISQLHSIACMGIYSKGYEESYKNSNIDNIINQCIPYINQAVSSVSCAECMKYCTNICDIITAKVLEFCKTDNTCEITDIIKELLRDTPVENIRKNVGEEKKGRGIIIGVLTDNKPDSNMQTSNEKPDIIIDLRTKKKEDGSNKDHSPDKGDNSSTTESSEKREAKSDESNNNTEGTKGENPSDSENRGCAGNVTADKKGSGNLKGEDSNSYAGDTSGESSLSDINPDNVENTLKESDEMTKEKLEEIIKNSIRASEEQTQSEIDSMIDTAKAMNKEAAEQKKDGSISKARIQEINNMFSGRGYEEVRASTYGKKYSSSIKAPEDLISKGVVLRNNIQTIINSRCDNDREEVYEGDLDVNSLSRLCIGQYDVFSSEGEPYIPDICCYILKDNSGSMSGNKEDECCKSLVILEEAIKEIIPLKIAAFCDNGGVIHNVIKDWDEKESYSYSWNYHNNFNCHGGNHDAYSIAVATEELLARSETNKLLIVISDGMPCCSQGEVQVAVHQAREKGIFVISLFIGSKQFQERYESCYELMYEKYYVGTNPELVSSQIYRLLEIFFETT